MSQQRPPLWREGMLVRSHHFQQWDRYLANRLRQSLAAAVPHSWGIVEWKVNETALSQGTFELESLVALWPDGEIIAYPGNTAMPTGVFEGRLERAGEMLPVHLALARIDPESPNTAEREDEQWGHTRYRVCRDNVSDLNRGKDVQKLAFREFDLKIVFGGEKELPERYDTVKVAEIRRSAQHSRPYLLAREYAPPCMRLSASRPLLQAVRDVTHRMNILLRRMHEKRASSTAADAPTDIKATLLAHSLHTFQPLLVSEIENGDCHPFRAFNLLCSLAGAIGSLHADRDLSEIQVYDHLDPLGSIRPLCSRIISDLGRDDDGDIQELDSYREGDYYHAAVSMGALDDSTLYLKIRGAGATEELRSRLRGVMKVASRGRIEKITDQALEGIKVKESGAPGGYPAQPDELFYVLTSEGDEWLAVGREDQVSAYLPVDDPELAVTVLVERGGGANR